MAVSYCRLEIADCRLKFRGLIGRHPRNKDLPSCLVARASCLRDCGVRLCASEVCARKAPPPSSSNNDNVRSPWCGICDSTSSTRPTDSPWPPIDGTCSDFARGLHRCRLRPLTPSATDDDLVDSLRILVDLWYARLVDRTPFGLMPRERLAGLTQVQQAVGQLQSRGGGRASTSGCPKCRTNWPR